MRKPASYALVAVIVLLAAATAVLFLQYRQKNSQYLSMRDSEETARNRYAQTIDAIAEIQDSLNAIMPGDTSMQMLSQNLVDEQRLAGPNSRQALDRIALLRAGITRSKERIQQLESSLHASGIKVNGLQKMVANLKASVAEKESQIADLSTRVDSLQTQVTGLATEVSSQQDTLHTRDQIIAENRQNIATVYYVVGNKKQLTMSGVIAAKGGVLGLGKTIKPTGQMNTGLFTALDTDQQNVVPIPAKKAQVVTPQPPSSYELKQVGDQMELHILDPVAFRTIKQLVIVTA